MSENKAYVGNLSYNTDEAGLEAFFSDCGEVSEVKLIKDYETGRSKGFAFVSFGSEVVDKKSCQSSFRLLLKR